MEQKTWWKAITYPERIDYLSFQNNELVFVLAIEKLLGARDAAEGLVDAHLPLRAEPHPLASRVARHRRLWSWVRFRCSGTASASASRSSTSSRWSAARACTRATSRPAASPRTSRAASSPRRASSCDWMPKAVDEYETLVDRNKIWLERTVGPRAALGGRRDRARPVGPGAARVRRRLGPARASQPYLSYAECDFDVPVYQEGDVYARYRVHMEEMRESVKIVAQCLDRLEAHGGRAVDRRRPQGRAAAARGAPHLDGVADPPLQDRHRGLPRARGRDLHDDRVAARRARLLRRLRRRPEAVAREVPRAVVRRARRRPRPA